MRTAPRVALDTAAGSFTLGDRPWVMGIVNASPDSFSDPVASVTIEERVRLAAAMLEAGADVIDVGGESATTRGPALAVDAEIERVVPLVERIAGELGALVSIDTYKPPVARAAVAAGAALVNDVSGLRDPELADVCAASGAALILMHTRAAPKQRLQDPDRYGSVERDVRGFLEERIALALGRGVRREQLIVDPGPDFAKTPRQTVEVLVDLETLHELGRPLLLAVSRKDFIGAITNRPPGVRLAGTLAAVAHGLDGGAHILRVHDVPAVTDFLKVRQALAGQRQVAPDLMLADELRWEAVRRSGR